MSTDAQDDKTQRLASGETVTHDGTFIEHSSSVDNATSTGDDATQRVSPASLTSDASVENDATQRVQPAPLLASQPIADVNAAAIPPSSANIQVPPYTSTYHDPSYTPATPPVYTSTPAPYPPQSSSPVYPQYPPTSYPPQTPVPATGSGTYPPQGSGGAYPVYQPYQPAPYPQPRPSRVVTPPANPNGVQRVLIRFFQLALASNPFFTVVLGGLVAIILGMLLFAVITPLTHNLVQPLIKNKYQMNYADTAFNTTPLQNPFRDAMQLFLVSHGTVTHIQVSSNDSNSNTSATNYSYSETDTLPFHGLLFIPALLLILGGYIAAASDFANRPTASLLCGAAVALPYTVLLLLLSTQVNGTIPSNSALGITQGPVTSSLNIDAGSLILSSLVWGVLFGLLGASLKLGQGHWRHMLYSSFHHVRSANILGIILGGVAAPVLGFFLMLVVVYALVANTSFSLPFFKNLCNTGDWQLLSVWSLGQGPLHALLLFMLAVGAPVSIRNDLVKQYGPNNYSCFYTNHAQTSFGLFSGDTHPGNWAFWIILIPLIALFIGGRISAARGYSQGSGPAAVQGALIAFPFTAIMMLLSIISMSSVWFTYSGIGSTTFNQPAAITQLINVNIGDIVLWSLLSGIIFGALGGAYQASTFRQRTMRGVLGGLLAPLLLIRRPFHALLNGLTGYPRTKVLGRGRAFLYDALLCALLLFILAFIAGALIMSLYQTVNAATNRWIRDLLAILLIALPGLFLIRSASTALSYDPDDPNPLVQPSGFFPPVGPQQYAWAPQGFGIPQQFAAPVNYQSQGQPLYAPPQPAYQEPGIPPTPAVNSSEQGSMSSPDQSLPPEYQHYSHQSPVLDEIKAEESQQSEQQKSEEGGTI